MVGLAYLASGPARELITLLLFPDINFLLLPIDNPIQIFALNTIGDAPTTKLIFEIASKAVDLVAEQPQETENTLEMSGVNFKYLELREQILRDINLSLEKSKRHAIVGPSGAASTTLIDIF